MNNPLSGSAAKACTLVRTPDLTRNVPSSDKENAKMASNTVHERKTPRFSVTAKL